MKTIPCFKTLWVTGLSAWLVACDGGAPEGGAQDNVLGWGFVYEAASASPSQAPRQREAVRPAAAESTTGAIYAFRWQDNPPALQTVLSDVEDFKNGGAVLEWEAAEEEFRAEYRGSLALVKRSGENWQVQLFDGSGETPEIRRVSDFSADEVCLWPRQEDGALTIETAGPDGQCRGLDAEDDNQFFIVHAAMSETRSAIEGKVVTSVMAFSQDVSAMGVHDSGSVVSDSGSLVRRYLTMEESTPTGGYRLYSRDGAMDSRREEPLLEGITNATALVHSLWDGTALIQVKSPDSSVQGVYWYDVVNDALTKTPLAYAVEYEFDSSRASSGVKQDEAGERSFFVAEFTDDGLALWELPTTPQAGASVSGPWLLQAQDYKVERLWHPGLVTPESPRVFAEGRHRNSHLVGTLLANLQAESLVLNMTANAIEMCGMRWMADQLRAYFFIKTTVSILAVLALEANAAQQQLAQGESGGRCAGTQTPLWALAPRSAMSLGIFAAFSNPNPNGEYRHEVAYWGRDGEKRSLFDIVSSADNFDASVYMFGGLGYALLDGAGGMGGVHKVVQRSDGSFETAKIPQQHGGRQTPF